MILKKKPLVLSKLFGGQAALCSSLRWRLHPQLTAQHGSVGRRSFSHLQRTCPHHMFSAACHKKIYQNLCTKATFPFSNWQIKKPLKTRIISGMLPFVGDGFMCPFPSHADSCFYSLMTTTASLQHLCCKGEGKQIGVPGWDHPSSLFIRKSSISQTSLHLLQTQA